MFYTKQNQTKLNQIQSLKMFRAFYIGLLLMLIHYSVLSNCTKYSDPDTITLHSIMVNYGLEKKITFFCAVVELFSQIYYIIKRI